MTLWSTLRLIYSCFVLLLIWRSFRVLLWTKNYIFLPLDDGAGTPPLMTKQTRSETIQDSIWWLAIFAILWFVWFKTWWLLLILFKSTPFGVIGRKALRVRCQAMCSVLYYFSIRWMTCPRIKFAWPFCPETTRNSSAKILKPRLFYPLLNIEYSSAVPSTAYVVMPSDLANLFVFPFGPA